MIQVFKKITAHNSPPAPTPPPEPNIDWNPVPYLGWAFLTWEKIPHKGYSQTTLSSIFLLALTQADGVP